MTEAENTQSLDIVLLDLAGTPIGLLAHQLTHLSDDVAQTASNIVSLSYCLGLTTYEPLPEVSNALLLEIKSSLADDRAFIVPKPLHWLNVSTHQLYPLPPLLAQTKALPGLAALIWHEGRFIYLIDLGAV